MAENPRPEIPSPDPALPLYALENQLHGPEYNEASVLLAEAIEKQGVLTDEQTYLNAALRRAQGGDPDEIGRSTPEGYAAAPPEYDQLDTGQAQGANERLISIAAELETVRAYIHDMSYRMWQEDGIRLFSAWRANELAPHDALERYFNLWNTYAPDEFYEHCGITKEELSYLFVATATSCAQSLHEARMPSGDVAAEKMVSKIKALAKDLGVDISDLDL